MQGMILQTPTENKDIKFIGKKGVDTKSEESDNLFENLIAKLVAKEEDGEESSFLLSKLLNLQSDFKNKGKVISEFSKGDILQEAQEEEIPLADLFKMALMLKSDAPTENLEKIAKELHISIDDKKVIAAFKEATNIKELLKVADKHGIKVKNFEFLNPEAALSLKDKKIVQKITSEEIFKMIEPKVLEKNILPQSVLTKIITKDIIKKELTKDKAPMTLTSLLTKETKTPLLEKTSPLQQNKSTYQTKPLNTTAILKENKEEIKSANKEPQTNAIQKSKQAILKPLTTQESIKTILEEVKIKDIKPKAEGDLKVDIETFKPSEQPKAKQNTLAALLKNDTFSKEIKPPLTQTTIEETPLKTETQTKETQETPIEKSTNTHEIKSESIHKTKETTDVKKTFNTFAMEFKEKVEAYKPPLMKINMQLSPANLGDVDVTLVSRGNNLQVNINSNSNTLALFIQNQAEFKNSLVNMGFTDPQMNFGEGKGEQRGQNHKKEENQQGNYHDSLEEENEEGISLILPNYV